jgi:RimJ/RimL family protein N-acetyltransferase
VSGIERFKTWAFKIEKMILSRMDAKRARLSSACGKTVLGAYEEKHVKEYNALMQDPQLLDLTGSEAQSLEEEYETYRVWQTDSERLCLLLFDESGFFVGDVNAFFRSDEDETVAEVTVMVARPSERQKGHAARALLLFFELLRKVENAPSKLEARIKLHNKPSIALFSKLGFVEESVSEAFGEVTFVRQI